MSHKIFGNVLVTPFECAIESLMHGFSIAHSTIIKDIMAAKIWPTENGLDFSLSELILAYLLVEDNF